MVYTECDVMSRNVVKDNNRNGREMNMIEGGKRVGDGRDDHKSEEDVRTEMEVKDGGVERNGGEVGKLEEELG